jgi:hypothetical protein
VGVHQVRDVDVVADARAVLGGVGGAHDLRRPGGARVSRAGGEDRTDQESKPTDSSHPYILSLSYVDAKIITIMKSCDAKLGHLDIKFLATSWVSVLRQCRQYRPAERRGGWRYLQARDVSCRCVKAGPRDAPVVPQRRTGPLAQPPLRVGSNDIEVPAGRGFLDEPSETETNPIEGTTKTKQTARVTAGTGGTRKKFPLPVDLSFASSPCEGGGPLRVGLLSEMGPVALPAPHLRIANAMSGLALEKSRMMSSAIFLASPYGLIGRCNTGPPLSTTGRERDTPTAGSRPRGQSRQMQCPAQGQETPGCRPRTSESSVPLLTVQW